jgi:hypothetical protein
MPKVNTCKSVACSEYTIKEKQPNFLRFIDSYLKNYKRPTLEWVECTAGKGEYDIEMEDGSIQRAIGSPIVMAKRVEHLRPELDFHMTLVEFDYGNYTSLKSILDKEFNVEGLADVICGDHKALKKFVDDYTQHGHGIIYYDPEGCSEFCGILDTLKSWPLFDVLCHMSSQSYKRTVARVDSQNVDPHYQMTPKEFIASCGKTYNYISTPSVKIGWYFLFCTDTPDLVKDIGQSNFLVPIDSPEGQIRLTKVSLTASEQGDLKDQEITQLKAQLAALAAGSTITTT